MKIPRWAQVLIGVGIVCVFLGIGAIIAVSAYFAQHVNVSTSSAREADEEFEKVRQQFKGRPALFEIKEGIPQQPAERAIPSGSDTRLQTLHVLAWDPDEDKLARVTIPWWVLRFKSGPIRFGTYASGFDDGRVRMTVEDIEKHGPGIIVEGTGRDGERFIVWAE